MTYRVVQRYTQNPLNPSYKEYVTYESFIDELLGFTLSSEPGFVDDVLLDSQESLTDTEKASILLSLENSTYELVDPDNMDKTIDYESFALYSKWKSVKSSVDFTDAKWGFDTNKWTAEIISEETL